VQSPPVHFFAKGLGVSPGRFANDTKPAAGLPVGLYLTTNTLVEVQK